MLQAKSIQSTDRMSQDTVKSFVLIGDPALKIPAASFSPAKVSAAPAPHTGGGGCSAFGSTGDTQESIWIQLLYFLFEISFFSAIYLIIRRIRQQF